MKFYYTLPLLFLLGCNNEPNIQYKTLTVDKIVYKTKIVKVPVYQPIPLPEVNCSFKGTNFEPTVKLLKCLIIHKHILDKIKAYNNKIKDSIDSNQ